MTFETLRSLNSIPAVHAKPDVGRANPDGQNKREDKNPRKDEQGGDHAHPVPNAQGQITGKLIDTTA